jgi:tetratricopeptide (TPR) repeat protein
MKVIKIKITCVVLIFAALWAIPAAAIDAGYYNDRANKYYEKGRYDDAIEDYTRALQVNPNDPVAYYDRANAYYRKGQYDRAVEDYTKAVEINPQDEEAYFNRGLAYFSLGRFEEAAGDYSRAIEIDPQDADAYNNRGNAYTEMGRYDEAVRDYTTALEIRPGDDNAYRNRELACERMSATARGESGGNSEGGDSIALGSNEQGAVAEGNTGKKRPVDSAFCGQKPSAAAGDGRDEESLLEHDQATDVDSGDTELLGLCWRVHCEDEEYEMPAGGYPAALDPKPESAREYYEAGNSLFRQEKYGQAVKAYTRAIELDPLFAGAYNSRGDALYRQGSFDAAFGDWQKSLEIRDGQPGSPVR